MSLIQDALKRKAEETPEPVPQPVPESRPEPVIAPQTPKEPKPLLIALIVLLMVALLVALGGLAFSLIKPSTPVKGTPAPEARPAAPAVETPAPGVQTEPVIAPPAVETPEPAAPTAPVAIEPPVTEPWPELQLTGIASSGTQRIAIINGKMLTIGRRIGEVIVRDVRDTEAVVEFRGEQRVLHVDE
jgi:uncharacterized membrane protein